MIIRCTAKLNKRVEGYHKARIPRERNPYLDWHCGLFSHEIYDYIIATNSKSLLTFIMNARSITNDDKLLGEFNYTLKEYLFSIGSRPEYEKYIEDDRSSIVSARANIKKVVQSMNEFVELSCELLTKGETHLFDVSNRLNTTRMNYLRNMKPLSVFRDMR